MACAFEHVGSRNEKIIYDLKVIKIYGFENNFHSKQTVL